MKSRLNLVLVAFLVAIGLLVWIVVRDRRTPVAMSATTATQGSGAPSAPTLKIQIQTVPPQVAAPPASDVSTPPGPTAPSPSSPVSSAAPSNDSRPDVRGLVRDESTGELKYTAQPGDTVSKLAATFLGSDSKTNQDAIISSNPSLQQDPDRVIAGQTYRIPRRIARAAGATVSASASLEPATQPAAAADVHELRYNARAGDTVSILAGALLGNDSRENRDAIISANPSLGEDPDRVIAGKTYRIPIQPGQPLAASASDAHAPAAPPTTQPDADQLVQAGSARELRYTAKAGDTVSTLAAALLGSDTKENRDAIVNSNPSLKQDPDRVVAGLTYWIPAPTALLQRP